MPELWLYRTQVYSRSIRFIYAEVTTRFKGKRAGAKEPYIEGIGGDDLHRKTGKWMEKERVIDRETNTENS